MGFKDLIVKCLSSSDEVSFGRAMSAIAFVSCILWDTFFIGYAACHLNWDHMVIQDILPSTERLLGQVKFCAACYGINKITEIASVIANKWNG